MTTLYIGLNDRETKKQKIKTKDAEMHIFRKHDATIFRCKGRYTHDDGTITVENSLKVEIFDKGHRYGVKLARELLEDFNQEAIYVDGERIERVA